MKDLKASLGNGIKPPISHVRGPMKTYIARGCDYGTAKYMVRANFLRPAGVPGIRGAFIRLGEYIESVDRHVTAFQDAMERHLSLDPELSDVEGMKTAAYAADDSPGNDKVGPSLLPHLAHAAAALNMAITQAVYAGLLPEDPGQPWTVIQKIDLGVFSKAAEQLVAEVASGLSTPDTECGIEIYSHGSGVDCGLPQGHAGDCDVFPRNEAIGKGGQKCPHDRNLGLACRECGGYAKRDVSKD